MPKWRPRTHLAGYSVILKARFQSAPCKIQMATFFQLFWILSWIIIISECYAKKEIQNVSSLGLLRPLTFTWSSFKPKWHHMAPPTVQHMDLLASLPSCMNAVSPAWQCKHHSGATLRSYYNSWRRWCDNSHYASRGRKPHLIRGTWRLIGKRKKKLALSLPGVKLCKYINTG